MKQRLLTMLGMAALMFSATAKTSEKNRSSGYTPEESKQAKKSQEKAKEMRLLANGLKMYQIDGISVVALNMKNAVRKVNKMKAAKA